MLDTFPNALAIAFKRLMRQPVRRTWSPRSGVTAVISGLALLHIVLVTTGAMDCSWAMAKSLATSHSQTSKEEAL